MSDDLIERLRKRAAIRRSIPRAKDGKPDRISDILEEAADEIERLTVAQHPRGWVEPTSIMGQYLPRSNCGIGNVVPPLLDGGDGRDRVMKRAQDYAAQKQAERVGFADE